LSLADKERERIERLGLYLSELSEAYIDRLIESAPEKMADRGLVDPDRILPGANHPSGTHWNRHNCQLHTSDDHSSCAKNVGCETIRGRSARLEAIVASRLASPWPRTETWAE
jgi:hypothetical protein